MFLKVPVPIYVRKAMTFFSYNGEKPLSRLFWRHSLECWMVLKAHCSSEQLLFPFELLKTDSCSLVCCNFFFPENAPTWAEAETFAMPLNCPGKGLAVHRGIKMYNSINIFSPVCTNALSWKPQQIRPLENKETFKWLIYIAV